jgi:hypothetical protein
LVDKRLSIDDILEEDSEIFSTEVHTAVGWLTSFQMSKLAKLGAGISLKAQSATGIPEYDGICDYAKTPAKRSTNGIEDEESPSWVDVGEEGLGFGEIKSWTPLAGQDAINKTSLANFEILRRETGQAAGNWNDALGEICESIQKLIVAQSQAEIQVGDPGYLEQRLELLMLSMASGT